MGLISRLRRRHPLRGLRRGERRAFQELTRSLALIGDPESLEASIAARLKDLLGIERIAAFQPKRDGGRFQLSYHRGFTSDEVDRLERLVLSRNGRLATWLRTNECPLVLEPRRAKGPTGFLEAELVSAMLALGVRACLPLLSFKRLSGIVLLAPAKRSWRPSADDLELLRLISTQAGLAVENALLERRHRLRLRRLDRAERLATIGQLAAGIAHEVRNPLTAIRSTVQFVIGSGATEADDASRRDHAALLDDVLREVDRIDNIVEGLLSLAPKPTSTPMMGTDPVDLHEILGDAVRLVTHEAREHGITIEGPRAEETYPVAIDGAELKQVVLNLLLNGMQSMPDGGVIEIAARAWWPPFAESSRAWVEVRIRDQGTGIEAPDLERAFDPFFTTKPGGTGLGLAICDGIIARHDGELRLEPAPEGGTDAVIRLPILRADSP